MIIFVVNIKTMLTNYLLTASLISLYCTGIYVATRKGMILYSFRKAIEGLLLSTINRLFGIRVQDPYRTALTICKPLFGCLMCMSSVWTLFFFLVFGIDWWNILFLIPIVAGINSIINSLIINIIPDEDN